VSGTEFEVFPEDLEDAPQSWRKEAASFWPGLPVQVQEQIVQRELHMQDVLQKNAKLRKQLLEADHAVRHTKITWAIP
jgi:hypothetical protein